MSNTHLFSNPRYSIIFKSILLYCHKFAKLILIVKIQRKSEKPLKVTHRVPYFWYIRNLLFQATLLLLERPLATPTL